MKRMFGLGLVVGCLASATGAAETRRPVDAPVYDDLPRIQIRRSPGAPVQPVEALRGWQALRAGNTAEAYSAYRKALAGDPNNPDALHGMAAAALRLGQTEEAREIYRRILELDPRDALAEIHSAPFADALSESRLRQLVETDETPAALLALGGRLGRSQRWAEAEQCFFRAAERFPECVVCLHNRAVALDGLGRRAEAESQYRRALDLVAASGPGVASIDTEVVRNRLAASARPAP